MDAYAAIPLSRRTARITAAQVSRIGERVVSASWRDGSARIWHIAMPSPLDDAAWAHAGIVRPLEVLLKTGRECIEVRSLALAADAMTVF